MRNSRALSGKFTGPLQVRLTSIISGGAAPYGRTEEGKKDKNKKREEIRGEEGSAEVGVVAKDKLRREKPREDAKKKTEGGRGVI